MAISKNQALGSPDPTLHITTQRLGRASGIFGRIQIAVEIEGRAGEALVDCDGGA